MTRTNWMARLLCRFAKDESGAAMVFIGLSIVVLTTAVGAAVDMSRAQLAQSRLSAALDAAGLAAGAVANSGDIQAEATRFFNANFPDGTLSAHPRNLVVTANDDNSVISLSVEADMDTSLMGVAGVSEITLSATSEVTRANRGLELVMVLDNTGSMTGTAGGGVTKIDATKTAAKDLVNILYGDRTSVPNLWIGLVPFSQAVNIGSARSSWTTNTALNWGTTSWLGCVEAREANGRDVTDDPPSVALFNKYYVPCDSAVSNRWYGTNSSRDNCSTAGSVRYKSGLGTSLGPNKNCPRQVTPMTGNKSSIITAIDAMTAVGNTHVNLGLAWGWRMLSPRWRGLWGGEMDTNSLPLAYDAPLMEKAVVLMTDGDNTMTSSVFTAYGYLSQGRLGSTSSSGAELGLDNRTTQVCNSMKANNIIVYTVALGTNLSTASQTMLRNCATKPEYYFNSPTTADLQVAFRAIADSLANLRLSR